LPKQIKVTKQGGKLVIDKGDKETAAKGSGATQAQKLDYIIELLESFVK
jgi:hypothetical protein